MEEPEELGPLPTSAGSLLAEDALAPSRFERGHLSSGVLMVGGNAGVTDQHCIMVLQNQCVLQYRFATSKPLKTGPGPDRCKTVPLCKLSTAIPFPLVAYDSRSVLAVKGPLRRFAPWTAPGRKEPFGHTSALTCAETIRGFDFWFSRLVYPQ